MSLSRSKSGAEVFLLSFGECCHLLVGDCKTKSFVARNPPFQMGGGGGG